MCTSSLLYISRTTDPYSFPQLKQSFSQIFTVQTNFFYIGLLIKFFFSVASPIETYEECPQTTLSSSTTNPINSSYSVRHNLNTSGNLSYRGTGAGNNNSQSGIANNSNNSNSSGGIGSNASNLNYGYSGAESTSLLNKSNIQVSSIYEHLEGSI